MICLPSMAPMQLGNCHFCWNLSAIARHSSGEDGTRRNWGPRCLTIAEQTSLMIYEIAALEIRNWKLRDLNVSPVTKYLNVTASRSGAVTTLLPPKICCGVMSASMYLEQIKQTKISFKWTVKFSRMTQWLYTYNQAQNKHTFMNFFLHTKSDHQNLIICLNKCCY